MPPQISANQQSCLSQLSMTIYLALLYRFLEFYCRIFIYKPLRWWLFLWLKDSTMFRTVDLFVHTYTQEDSFTPASFQFTPLSHKCNAHNWFSWMVLYLCSVLLTHVCCILDLQSLSMFTSQVWLQHFWGLLRTVQFNKKQSYEKTTVEF